ncbi:MAG: hypothetical protein WCO84_01630 [bacterium]
MYKADTFSFGTLIGSITNKGSSGYALLSNFKKNSLEYITTLNRLKMSCKLQSATIDKTKLGKSVKGIPKKWITRSKDELNNSILLNKHPYFFTYLYKDTKKKYKEHIRQYNIMCKRKFRIDLETLLKKEEKSEIETDFVKMFEMYCPVITSDSVMNKICKYLENFQFEAKKKKSIKESEKSLGILFNKDIYWEDSEFIAIKKAFREFKTQLKEINNIKKHLGGEYSKYFPEKARQLDSVRDLFDTIMNGVCSNSKQVANYLIYMIYGDEDTENNKELMWQVCGEFIFDNLLEKNSERKFNFPLKNKGGDILYLGNNYRWEEISID